MLKRQDKGLLILLEGIDGSGKGTQKKLLRDYLESLDKYNEIFSAREPTRNAKLLQEKAKQYSIDDGHEDKRLFLADREDHSVHVLYPVLKGKGIVILDRYTPSTIAYQGAQGQNTKKILEDSFQSNSVLRPDITLLFDLPVKIAQQRIHSGRDDKERFESEKFQKLVREFYKMMSDSNSLPYSKEVLGKIERIDASQSEEQVFNQVKNIINPIYRNWAEKL